jgi:hypothetical protein
MDRMNRIKTKVKGKNENSTNRHALFNFFLSFILTISVHPCLNPL